MLTWWFSYTIVEPQFLSITACTEPSPVFISSIDRVDKADLVFSNRQIEVLEVTTVLKKICGT
jgi:hypothetical protein